MTQLLYSMGSAASSIKQTAISSFLLIYYNQVVGLSPATVSSAIATSLVFDAVCDPAVGQLSDNFRHRWGRRHPFMYFAAIPVPIAFFLLWNPPVGWSEGALFVYLLVVLLCLRLFDTFFELPSAALLPELTRDYHKRTVLIALRMAFSVGGSLIMTAAAYMYFMKEKADGSGGILARDGYSGFSITFSIAIFTIIVASALGTHRLIPHLHTAPARQFSIGRMAMEMYATLNNLPFVLATSSGIMTSIAMGVAGGLTSYMSLFFWEFRQWQMSAMMGAMLGSSVVGMIVAPILSRRWGKKRLWLAAGTLTTTFSSLPVLLRLAGLVPPNGSAALFAMLLVCTACTGLAGGLGMIAMTSMIADVVEEVEVRTGRRSEGLLLAADNLFKKLVSSSGVLISGLILTFINFPKNAERGAVSADLLFRLGILATPLQMALTLIGVGLMIRFPISEQRHLGNLRQLNEKASVD